MKAIILTAGKGRRLGHLTESRPKAMIPIEGKPVLEHLLRNASYAGVNEFVISLGCLGETIQEYFGDGSRLGVRIEYNKSKGRGPEDAIFEARKHITDDCLLCLCGDNILLPSQIERILRVHTEKEADATFTIEEGDTKTIKRVKLYNRRITSSSTDPSDPVLVYNFAAQSSFLDKLYDLVKDKRDKAFAFAIDKLIEEHRIYVAPVLHFMNINRPEDIPKAELFLKALREC